MQQNNFTPSRKPTEDENNLISISQQKIKDDNANYNREDLVYSPNDISPSDSYYSAFFPNTIQENETLNNINDRSYRDFNDQKDPSKNDLSHEANYKLSKIEQDNVDRNRIKFPSNLNEKMHLKKSIQPAEEINLKISDRLMSRGMSASLPSNSNDDNNKNWNHHYKKRHHQKRAFGRKLLETDESDDQKSTDPELVANRVHKLQKALYNIKLFNTLTRENVQDFVQEDLDDKLENVTLKQPEKKRKQKIKYLNNKHDDDCDHSNEALHQKHAQLKHNKHTNYPNNP